MAEMAEVSADSSSPRYTRSPGRMERAALFRADGLPPVNRAAAAEAVRDFVAALDASDFGPYSDVLVYGSRVRDDWDEYSDIDVAVVVPGKLSGGELFMRLEELTAKTLDVRWAHWRLSTVVVCEGALAFPYAVKGNSEFYRNLRVEGVSWGAFCGGFLNLAEEVGVEPTRRVLAQRVPVGVDLGQGHTARIGGRQRER